MSYRLLINATILNQPRLTGLGVHAVNMTSRVARSLKEDPNCRDISLIGAAARLKEVLPNTCALKRVQVIDEPVIHPLRRILRLTGIVTAARRSGERIVLYSPTHHGVAVKGIRQVVTVHDLFARLFPHNYRMQYLYFKYYLPRVLKKCDVVLGVSDNTLADLRRFCGHLPRTVRIYGGLRDELSELAPEAVPTVGDKPFFLFVGPNYWYKNAERVIAAFAGISKELPEHSLVFAGGTESYLGKLKRLVGESYSHIESRVTFPGYVTAGQLAWLYTRATALVIATLYEGFGLPALEAMHFNCPVIGSDRGALPEICGEAALLVDPERTTAIAEAMAAIATESDLRKELVARGRQNLSRFSWDRSAETVAEVIRDLGR